MEGREPMRSPRSSASRIASSRAAWKSSAEFDEFGAERAHRGVLLDRIAVAARRSSPAVRRAARRKRGSGRDCRGSPRRALGVAGSRRISASTKVSPPRTLKAPVGMMVLVLDDDLGAEPRARAAATTAPASAAARPSTTSCARRISCKLNIAMTSASPHPQPSPKGRGGRSLPSPREKVARSAG